VVDEVYQAQEERDMAVLAKARAGLEPVSPN
jgi:hypothetical protein